MPTQTGRDANRTEAPERSRPGPRERFAAAVELATSGAASFRRTARRYSICTADADDAYQRSLEILLTKAPTADRSELRPWLHTVIKHEALAVRRQRERTVAAEDTLPAEVAVASPERGPDETAGERERVRRTAEALGALRPNELQCLVLKALGYSYDEISARTGFSWTKVNRSLTEGRRRFFARFGEIASGRRCDRFVPVLSAVCDGHATDEQERMLRSHLSSCQGCRAALRAYRSAPARLAELVPPAVVLPLLARGGLWSRMSEWLSAGGGERAGAIGAKLQQGAEMVSAQKAAAVVASTAALAGGGAAVHEHVRALPEREAPAHVQHSSGTESQPEQQTAGAPPAQTAPPAPQRPDPPDPEPREQTVAQQAQAEFGPEQTATEPMAQPVSQEGFGAPASSGGRASSAAAGGSEFGP